MSYYNQYTYRKHANCQLLRYNQSGKFLMCAGPLTGAKTLKNKMGGPGVYKVLCSRGGGGRGISIKLLVNHRWKRGWGRKGKAKEEGKMALKVNPHA